MKLSMKKPIARKAVGVLLYVATAIIAVIVSIGNAYAAGESVESGALGPGIHKVTEVIFPTPPVVSTTYKFVTWDAEKMEWSKKSQTIAVAMSEHVYLKGEIYTRFDDDGDTVEIRFDAKSSTFLMEELKGLLKVEPREKRKDKVFQYLQELYDKSRKKPSTPVEGPTAIG
jgi:hypothetical protein